MDNINRRYLEWFESSCFRLLCKQIGLSEDDLFHQAEAITKLHALWGGRLIVDSMGLIGSQVVMRLFADSSFRKFLSKHPDFLKISSIYTGEENRGSRGNVSLSPLRRAIDPKWVSSTFADQTPIVQLSEIVLKRGGVDVQELLAPKNKKGVSVLISKYPQYKEYLLGALNGLSHFSNNKDTPFDSSDPTERVHPLLVHTLKSSNLPPEYEKRVALTISFIERHFSDPSTVSHSEIIDATRSTYSVHDPAHRIILQTVSHAFNASLVRSLDPEYGSYAFFPQGAPIGLYLDSMRDILVPSKKSDLMKHYPIVEAIGFKWSPSSISWDHIIEAIDDDDVRGSAETFQNSLRDGNQEQIKEHIYKHSQSLAKALSRHNIVQHRGYLWILNGIAIAIGTAQGELQKYAPVVSATAIASGMIEFIDRGFQYLTATVYRHQGEKLVPRLQILDEQM